VNLFIPIFKNAVSSLCIQSYPFFHYLESHLKKKAVACFEKVIT